MTDISTLPIDIHCSKLLDWLRSRRHIKSEWPQKLSQIRQLISSAIGDMPENDEIATLLSNASLLTYVQCKKIVDILSTTEADTKNIFGRYSSQRMKDWQNIIAKYEEDNVYLAEIASLLVDLAQYQIPGFKKRISRLEATIQDCEKKKNDYERQARDADLLFTKVCERYNISGTNVPLELINLASNLPEKHEEIVAELRTLWPTVEHYIAFFNYVLGSKLNEEAMTKNFEIFRFIVENGNVTTFQFKRGFPPSEIISLQDSILQQLEKQVDKNEDEIDFGDDLFETEAMQSADYGIEEIAVVDDKNLKDSNCKSHPNVEESVARGEEALTVLENVFTNALLLTELLELKSFFKMRHHELNTDHFASELLFANDSVRLLANGMSFVEKWLQATEQIIQKLQDPVLCHLTELRSKAEYLEYLSSEIYSHKERAEKCRQTVDALNNRQKDATKEIQQLLEEIQNLAAIARDLKSFIEQNISKRYNNRKVNIVGSTVTI
ncbi:CDK5RAP3-like protein [Trichinella pseudospiralis]|uniref:CDK5RAP3-like protein n=1 Tax=Trichinella pseudospiralis TaxID=6337 RepID=A0A0V1FY29_TRIPS|nr:CDK5RAP3-like protein [Trichinella pseudospiralis]